MSKLQDAQRLLDKARDAQDRNLADTEQSLVALVGKRAGVSSEEMKAVKGLWKGIQEGKINFNNVDLVADKVSTEVSKSLPSLALTVADQSISAAMKGNLTALEFGTNAAKVLASGLSTAALTPVLGPAAPMAGVLAVKIVDAIFQEPERPPSAAEESRKQQEYLAALQRNIDSIVRDLVTASCYGDDTCSAEIRAEVDPLVRMAWLRSPYSNRRDQSLFLALNQANIARIVTRARFRSELTFLKQVQAAADRMTKTFLPQCPAIVPSCSEQIRAIAWKAAFDVATTAQRKDFGAAQVAENALLLLASEVAESQELAGLKEAQWSSERRQSDLFSQVSDQQKLLLKIALGLTTVTAIGLIGYALVTSGKEEK